MEGLLTFLSEYYYIFIILAIILIFAIIGYIVDSKNIKLEKPKTVKVDLNSHGDIKDLPKTKDGEVETLDEIETLDTNEEISTKADIIEESNPNPELDKTEVLDTIVEEPNTQEESEKEIEQETPAPLIEEEQNNESTFQK